MRGSIILLNGATSSGKSTLARALQAALDGPFWHLSIDHLLDAGVLPRERIERGDFAWAELRPAFFDGFHRCLPVLAEAGNALIVEHIVETEAWRRKLLDLLAPFDVFYVGLHCPLEELERREAARGDRPLGQARIDFASVHAGSLYDLDVDATTPVAAQVQAVAAAWRARRPPGAFARMRMQQAG